jgi:RimJ/RimL family protein N-acetyltransferase
MRHHPVMAQLPPDRIALDGARLRRERVGDEALIAPAVHANLEHLRPWMPWATPSNATSDAQRRRLADVERTWTSDGDYSFLLLDPEETTLLGVFGLHRRIGPGGIELGYWLSQDAVGKGLATAAAKALTAAALDLPDVDRVEIHCDEANSRSRKIPERLGYRLDRIEDDKVEAPGEIGRSMIWIYPA